MTTVAPVLIGGLALGVAIYLIVVDYLKIRLFRAGLAG
jgi:hypothetical protein